MMQHSVFDHRYLKYFHHGVLPCSLVTLWLILYIKITVSRVKLDLNTLGMYFLKALFLHFGLLGWPNRLCLVLSVPRLLGWLALQVKESLHFLSLHHSPFLRQNSWLPFMALVRIGQFLIIFISLGIIWKFFPVSREVHLVIYLLTKF